VGGIAHGEVSLSYPPPRVIHIWIHIQKRLCVLNLLPASGRMGVYTNCTMATLANDHVEPILPESHHRSRWRVLGAFLVVSWAVFVVADRVFFETAVSTLGEVVLLLMFPLGLLIVGLSILLSTAEGFDGRHGMSLGQVALVRIVVTLIAVAVVVQSLSSGFPIVEGDPPDSVKTIFRGLYLLASGTAVMAFVLSLALAWRAAEQPNARALAFFMAFLALYWGPLLNIMQFGYAFRPDEPEPNSVSFSFTTDGLGGLTMAALSLSVAAFVRFSALFPRLLKKEDLQSSKFLRPLRAIRFKLLNPAIVWGVFGGMAIHLIAGLGRGSSEEGGASLDEIWIWLLVVPLVFVGLPLFGMIVGALNLRSGYMSSAEAERKKILWVVAGCVVGTCMILVALAGLFVYPMVLVVILPLAPLVLVLCLGVSVFYRGAIHPALIIKRATLYGILGALLVAMFSAVESFLAAVLQDSLGFSSSASSASLGGLLAVVLMPVRSPLSRWLGGWLPRAEGDN